MSKSASKNMETIPFKLSKEHYIADVCIVWCTDDRCKPVLKKLIETRGYKKIDRVIVPGGAKALACPDSEEGRVDLRRIVALKNIHHWKTIILMIHSDCGACGGLKSFENDCQKERDAQEKDLEEARIVLREKIGNGVKIECVFVDFDGINFLR